MRKMGWLRGITEKPEKEPLLNGALGSSDSPLAFNWGTASRVLLAHEGTNWAEGGCMLLASLWRCGVRQVKGRTSAWKKSEHGKLGNALQTDAWER